MIKNKINVHRNLSKQILNYYVTETREIHRHTFFSALAIVFKV